MQLDGFNVLSTSNAIQIGGTSLMACEYKSSLVHEIDSCLLIEYRDQAVLNMNDISYQKQSVTRTLDALNCPKITCLLAKHAGASPYPQMYYDIDSLPRPHQEKKEYNMYYYRQMINHVNPTYVLPFAGDYFLGSDLLPLNNFRGMYDTCETPALDSRSIPLDIQSGKEYFDLESGMPSLIKSTPTDQYIGFISRMNEISSHPRIKHYPELTQTQILTKISDTIPQAFSRWSDKSEFSFDFSYRFFFDYSSDLIFFIYIVNKTPTYKLISTAQPIQIPTSPQVDIYIGSRLFLAAILCDVHWNNIFGGSQCSLRRNGDQTKCMSMESKLWFFHI